MDAFYMKIIHPLCLQAFIFYYISKMKKVFYLKTCDTCLKILKKYSLKDWELREIKINPVTEEEIEEMYKLAGSYEALFSKKSNQIKDRKSTLNSSHVKISYAVFCL